MSAARQSGRAGGAAEPPGGKGGETLKPRRYSSLSAFLAHYRALSFAQTPSAEERRWRQQADELMDELTETERAALDSTGSASPEQSRRRWRAEVKLARVLAARGVLSA